MLEQTHKQAATPVSATKHGRLQGCVMAQGPWTWGTKESSRQSRQGGEWSRKKEQQVQPQGPVRRGLGVWQAGSECFLAGDFGEAAGSLSLTWLQQ